MKYTIDAGQRDFFRRNGWIEFENLLSPDQVSQWNRGVDRALAKRAQVDVEKLGKVPSEQLVKKSYDLWREDEPLKKKICSLPLARIAQELTQCKSIRLGFDRLLFHWRDQPNAQAAFAEISCINGLCAILLLCLTESGSAKTSEADLFPSSAGSGVYLLPTVPFDFSYLAAHPDQRYLIIGYAQPFSQYWLNEKDVYVYQLKNLGYIYGDGLKDALHPVLLR